MGAETTSIGGALVPTVKSEPAEESAGEPAPTQQEMEQESDKDILCPICMQIIKDAFLTACGHSFCYMCIVTHLQNKSDCPCCSHFLTANHLYPNFLLNKRSRLTGDDRCNQFVIEAQSLLECEEFLKKITM